MSELKFTRVNNEEYNTVSIKIKNAFIEIKNEDYYTIETEKNQIRIYKINYKNN